MLFRRTSDEQQQYIDVSIYWYIAVGRSCVCHLWCSSGTSYSVPNSKMVRRAEDNRNQRLKPYKPQIREARALRRCDGDC